MSEPRPEIDRVLRAVLDDGVILCFRLGRGQDLPELSRAAARGGLRIHELTLTTPGALEAMSALSAETSGPARECLVGGGTVLSVDQVRAVKRAGGSFVLSPVFDPAVVDEAGRLGLLAIPGTATPAESLAAHRHGARAVKIFPAGALGGPAYLKAIRGPLPDIPFIPTSGPSAENLADYMRAGAVAVGVGAEVFPPGFTAGSVEAAARRVREAMDAYRSRPVSPDDSRRNT